MQEWIFEDVDSYADIGKGILKGIPRAKELFYGCKECGGVVPSRAGHNSGCGCLNIFMDLKIWRLSVRDYSQIFLLKIRNPDYHSLSAFHELDDKIIGPMGGDKYLSTINYMAGARHEWRYEVVCDNIVQENLVMVEDENGNDVASLPVANDIFYGCKKCGAVLPSYLGNWSNCSCENINSIYGPKKGDWHEKIRTASDYSQVAMLRRLPLKII
jgi:hypothetical protein